MSLAQKKITETCTESRKMKLTTPHLRTKDAESTQNHAEGNSTRNRSRQVIKEYICQRSQLVSNASRISNNKGLMTYVLSTVRNMKRIKISLQRSLMLRLSSDSETVSKQCRSDTMSAMAIVRTVQCNCFPQFMYMKCGENDSTHHCEKPIATPP